MSHFPPEKSILHILSKAQIRLLLYWRALAIELNNHTVIIEAYPSGTCISPLSIPIEEKYVPFQWRLSDEVEFHPLNKNQDTSLILGYEVLWNEDLWAITPYVERKSLINEYREPLRERVSKFNRQEVKELSALRIVVDKALDSLLENQEVRDQLFESKVSYEQISPHMQELNWDEEPRKSLYN